jgi:hypothetical protein
VQTCGKNNSDQEDDMEEEWSMISRNEKMNTI